MSKKTISPLLLERYICGEITKKEKEMLDREYRENTFIRSGIDALRQSNTDVFAMYPVEKTAMEIALKMHREKVHKQSVTSKANYVLLGLPAWSLPLIFFVLLFIPLSLFHHNFLSSEKERIKGAKPLLIIYRDESNQYNKLNDNSFVKPGDRLQIAYQAAGKNYGLIFSVDGNGTITLHFPEDTTVEHVQSRLKKDGKQLLHASFELDSAPLFERFYFLTSDDPINVTDVLALCKKHFDICSQNTRLRIDELPQQITQSTITLKKDYQ